MHPIDNLQEVPPPAEPVSFSLLESGNPSQFPYPPGIGLLVDEMIFAVLRYEPSNIYEFLAKLLEVKLEKRSKEEAEENERQKEERYNAKKVVDPELLSFLKEINLTKELADKYATKIEAVFKGYRVRRSLEEQGMKLHKDHKRSWEWQRWGWEGSSELTEEQLTEFLESLHLGILEASKCATKIQAVFRGYQVRKSKDGENVQEVVEKKRTIVTKTQKSDNGRLPINVIPAHYEIRIRPRFDTLKFEGNEFIHILIREETSEIVMNAVSELIVCAVVCKDSTGNEQVAEQVVCIEGQESIRVQFEPPLQPGYAILYILFWGTMKEDMRGIYFCKWPAREGESEERIMIATQFEPIDSRKAFPCFDEPEHKASFSISLVVEKSKTSLSNMPLKEVKPYTGEEETVELREYATTPNMSTYLVAFAVGDFDFVEAITSTGILCRVYTEPGEKEQGNVALDVASRILPFFAEYFDVPYPFPKLDLLALPELPFSAMENWGLITFDQTSLLWDEKQSSEITKQWIAIVVCHEISHMWFGNMVTMKWWNEIWLKESFATFFETYGANHLFPEYDLWTQFALETIFPALELDALKNSHSVHTEVNLPKERFEIFDEICYSKGASIIRMLYTFIGEVEFSQGINIYLTNYKYRNATGDDLWNAFEEASGKPIRHIINTWIKQTGFPLIRVNIEEINGAQVLSLSQERFYANSSHKLTGKNKGPQWMIPITVCSKSSPTEMIADFLMEERSVTLFLPEMEVLVEGEDDEWVKVNPNVTGFYRVHYPPELLKNFVPAIQNKSLPPIDRLGLLSDLFALTKSGENTTLALLEFLQAYKEEDDYTVWEIISHILKELNFLLESSEYHQHFKVYGRKLVSGIVNKTEWEATEGESHLAKMLRSLALSLQILFRDPEDEKLTLESTTRIDLHLQGTQIIPPDIRKVVYTAVLSSLQEGVEGEEMLEKMFNLYKEATFSEEKERIGQSLGAVKDTVLLKKLLEFALFSTDVTIGHGALILGTICSLSKEGRRMVWELIKGNVDLLRERYIGGGEIFLQELFKQSTKNCMLVEDALEVEEFFKDNPFSGMERLVLQFVENIKLNAAWFERDGVTVGVYLANL